MAQYNLFNNIERVTKIKIFATPTNGKTAEIGVVQSISPSESRDVASHFTLGGENPEVPKALIPQLVTNRTLSVKAIALFKNSIIKQMGGNAEEFIVSLKQQTQPFDIQVVKQKAGDPTQTYSVTYTNCLMTSYSTEWDITRGDVTVFENCTITFMDVVAA